MRNWFDIVTPHQDIREGNFDEAVFAADLGDVVAGRAVPDYNDPFAFYKKTYLTEGLKDLLHTVHKKLAGGQGPSVVELQTPFGGGKTHALVLIYHYLKNGDRIENLLPEGLELLTPNVATVVGTHLNPSQGNTSDGVHRHTLWGEIVFQLGGEAAYRQIEQNDRNRIPLGKDDLYQVLEPLQPFILLLDEILEYVVSARSVPVGDQSLGSQTLKFFKELTDTVAILKHGLVIATLPSSELEDFGDAHQRNLAQLEKVFGRVETIETPVQGEEVYSIIRRRLFDAIQDEAAVREVADSYVQKYQQHKDELPQKAREADYRRKLELAYPFHPDVIDVLYEKWGTFSSFQRTRGVLRLLAGVVEDLYQSERNLDLILPGDINLGRPAIRQEFIRHIGPEYESIIGSDIAGVEAKSQALDQANKGWKHLAERIATAIFMHSFAVDSSEKGATLPYVKLAVMRPEAIPSLVTEVLQKQANELWYLNTRGDQYYFSRVPNLNRMVLDKKSLVQPAAAREELERRIKRELGTALRCYLWPSSSETLPDNQELKLAVMNPENTPDLRGLERWVDRRGDGFRVYKNTLFFALPDRDRYARLADTIREYLALGEIKQEIDKDERSSMQEKREEVKRRLRDIEEDFPLKVRELYRTAAVPRNGGTLEQIDFGQPAVGRENLDTWYRGELADQTRGKILTRPPSARLLQAKFLSHGDAVSLSAVLEQFYKDPGLPALADPSILAVAIVQGVRDGSFGIGRGSLEKIAPASVHYEEIISPDVVNFSEDVFLLTSEWAKALKKQLRPEVAPTSDLGPELRDPGVEPSAPGLEPWAPEPGPHATDDRIEHVTFRASGIPVSKIADLNRGVFLPLAREAGDFTFTIEISVHTKDGISRKVIDQQVMETLQQLGAKVE